MVVKNIIAKRPRTQPCADYAYLYLMLALIDVSKIADFITPPKTFAGRGPMTEHR